MEFVCKDAKATVRAANVKATLDAFRLLPGVGQRLIERHKLKLDDLTPEKTVPVQFWLNALKELRDGSPNDLLRHVGSAIVENAEMPPVFDTVEKVLLALDDIYYVNHKGDVGHYVVRQNNDGSIDVRCETPYPRQFERGLIEGFARNVKLAKTKRYTVDYVDGAIGTDHTCTLTVRAR